MFNIGDKLYHQAGYFIILNIDPVSDMLFVQYRGRREPEWIKNTRNYALAGGACDASGHPMRFTTDRIKINGRWATIVANDGLLMLCPCPDTLFVRYDDTGELDVIANDVFDSDVA